MTKLDHHIGHRKHYNQKTLTTLLKQSGFNNFKVYAAGWPFFNLYRLMLLSRGDKLVGDISAESASFLKTKAIQVIGLGFSFYSNLMLIQLIWAGK